MSVRLFALTCGWVTGPAEAFLAGESGRLRVPVPAFLIDHPRGMVLFDFWATVPQAPEVMS